MAHLLIAGGVTFAAFAAATAIKPDIIKWFYDRTNAVAGRRIIDPESEEYIKRYELGLKQLRIFFPAFFLIMAAVFIAGGVSRL